MCSVIAFSLDTRTKIWMVFKNLRIQVDSLLKSLVCLVRLYQPTLNPPFKHDYFQKSFPKDLFLCEDSTCLCMLPLVVLSCMAVMEISRKSVFEGFQEKHKETLHSKGYFLSLFCWNCHVIWFNIFYSWKADPLFLCNSRVNRV